MKQVRTIKYKGGKGAAFNVIAPFFPSRFNRFIEPFCGSATSGLTVKARNPDIELWINDAWSPIASLFHRIQNDCPSLQRELHRIYKSLRKNENDARKYYKGHFHQIDDIPPKQQAKHLWLIQRMAHTGNLTDGGFSKQCWDRTHEGMIDELSYLSYLLQGAKITSRCYSDVLTEVSEGDFTYCDPPYSRAWSQYRHGHFNIDNLLCRAKCQTMISYDVLPPNVSEYGFKADTVEIFHYPKRRKVQEIVLRNY